jgi:hypothetical protein
VVVVVVVVVVVAEEEQTCDDGGGVGNVIRNGAGRFILFIKCNTCRNNNTLTKMYLLILSTQRKKGTEAWFATCNCGDARCMG